MLVGSRAWNRYQIEAVMISSCQQARANRRVQKHHAVVACWHGASRLCVLDLVLRSALDTTQQDREKPRMVRPECPSDFLYWSHAMR